MNRLVRNDLNGVPSPSLATSWSANADASEWTFNLRKGVKFHDSSTLMLRMLNFIEVSAIGLLPKGCMIESVGCSSCC